MLIQFAAINREISGLTLLIYWALTSIHETGRYIADGEVSLGVKSEDYVIGLSHKLNEAGKYG